MADLATAERALRDYMVKDSTLGRVRVNEHKHSNDVKQPFISVQLSAAEADRHGRVLARLWRRFYAAGGTYLR